MAVKVLTPEQLFDSLVQVLGAPQPGEPASAGKAAAAARIRNVTPRTVFVTFFKGDDNADPTEYQAGIPQVLRLMNSPQLNNAAMLAPILKAGKTPEQVDRASVPGHAVAPADRRTKCSARLALVRKTTDEPRQAYGDILWALLNCSEFTLNH